MWSVLHATQAEKWGTQCHIKAWFVLFLYLSSQFHVFVLSGGSHSFHLFFSLPSFLIVSWVLEFASLMLPKLQKPRHVCTAAHWSCYPVTESKWWFSVNSLIPVDSSVNLWPRLECVWEQISASSVCVQTDKSARWCLYHCFIESKLENPIIPACWALENGRHNLSELWKRPISHQ